MNWNMSLTDAYKQMGQRTRELVYSFPISPALQEMLLEGLRLALFAAISAFVTFLIDKLQTVPDADIWVMALTFILRLIDKWKHEDQKSTINTYHGGLIGF